MLFQPDIFSVSRPGWEPVSDRVEQSLKDVLSCLPLSFLPLLTSPQQSCALNINSSNFRLITPVGVYLLKRWSSNSQLAQIRKTLDLMVWLTNENLPVPRPVEFQCSESLLNLNGSVWSLFPFFEGHYFSGAGNELESAAMLTGRLASVLSYLPSDLRPESGPERAVERDGKLLESLGPSPSQWDQLIGPAYSQILTEYWPEIISEWEFIRKLSINSGDVQASHYDLHPHNLLMHEARVSAVLDFESCKLMPVGYALSYAALKLCRQAVAYSKDPASARSVAIDFIDTLIEYYPGARLIKGQFGHLAVSEVLRRICLILRINVENNNNQWNHVLPIQLSHLREARVLFGT